MAKHTLSFSDEESAAMAWAVAQANEKTIPEVETWLTLKVRGEVAAIVLAYREARKGVILESYEKADRHATVRDVDVVVEASLRTPQAKGDEAVPGLEDGRG